MTTEHDIVKELRCPRCGYDQRGPVSTWTDSCPLQGVCSECGLIFNWAEVIVPEKFEPHWCVEFAPHWRDVPSACVKSSFRSLWPWTFWQRLNMSQAVRKRRLLAYCGFLLLPFILGYIAGSAAVAISAHASTKNYCATYPTQATSTVKSLQDQLAAMQFAQQLLAVPEDQRDAMYANLPTPTIYDAASFRNLIEQYANASLPLNPQIMNRYQALVATYQAQATAAPVLNQPLWRAIGELILFPTQRYSAGSIQFADGTVQPYSAPYDIWEGTLGISLLRGSFPQSVGSGLRAISGVVAAILMSVLLPCMFILLPMTRRRAKVRWIHVLRVSLYSAALADVLVIVLAAAGALQLTTGMALAQTVLSYAPSVFLIALPFWWAVAIKRYLKMPHAAAIAALMSILLMLLMMPLLQFVLPEWIVSWVLS